MINTKFLERETQHQQVASSSKWQTLLKPVDVNTFPTLGEKWMEYQGLTNWEGLLDPLDDNLRAEILRYGLFVDAAYRAFDFNPSSPTYATCKFPKSAMFEGTVLETSGYQVTKNLRATSGFQLPGWVDKAPSWVATRSSWIGYVAVCDNKKEISRLGRRDVVISLRGTATGLEWLENLRATLTHLRHDGGGGECGPMVESGFLSLYTSSLESLPSLQDMIREEVGRIIQTYGDEPLSFTITGHSLGAALATLAAYDIKTYFKRSPLVTVVSFGGPRVGNGSFRRQLEKKGTKVLRIVNSDDLITKVPGFVVDGDDQSKEVNVANLPSWIQKRVEDTQTQWVYAEVGKELKLSEKESSFFNSINLARCHELGTYLDLVNGFASSRCPLREKAKEFLNHHSQRREVARVY